MNNKKTKIAMICAAWAVAQPVMTFASSGVIELEMPGMNPVTAASVFQNVQAANCIFAGTDPLAEGVGKVSLG